MFKPSDGAERVTVTGSSISNSAPVRRRKVV
jgi:hypothetical protein